MVRVLAVLLAGPGPSVPPPPVPAEYELRWQAPAECPDAATIVARVAALRGEGPAGEGTAIVAAEVTAGADGFTLVLTTSFADRTHVRTMNAPVCAELAESTAIVVAVALRHGVAAAMTSDPPPTPPAAVGQAPVDDAAIVEPAVQVVAPPPIAVARPRRPPPGEPLARIEGLGELGALGTITGGARLTLGLDWRRARAELYGLYLAPRLRALDDERGALFQGGAVGARGCFVVRSGALAVPLCAGMEAGTVRVDTRRLSPRRTEHTPWAGAAVGLGLARTFGPVRVWLGVDAVVRVFGSRFYIDGDVAFEQLPVSLRWALGLEIPLGPRAPQRSRGRGKKPANPDTGSSGSAR